MLVPTAAFIMVLAAASQPKIDREPVVCADPARPCAGFREHDLSFPRQIDGMARAEEPSAPFFAVILASGARCAIPEAERRRAQALFPARKVFSSRFGCDDDVENNVCYTNADENRAFIAVHAGATREAADAIAAEARAKGFAGANARRMQAVLVHP